MECKMAVTINGKEINNPYLKLIVVIAALAVVGITLAIVLPIVGIILGIIIAALVIAIPFVVIFWHWGISKVSTKIGSNIDVDESSMDRHVGSVLERRGIDKSILVISKHSDLDIQGVDQDTLIVESEDRSIFICETEEKLEILLKEDAKLVLPSSADLKVLSGAGDIKVFHINSIEIASGAGNVDVDQLGISTKVATAAGNVAVSFKEDVEHGTVSIATASGEATVSLPDGATVNFKKKVIVGKIKSEFESTDDGRFLIKFASASGNLNINKKKLLN